VGITRVYDLEIEEDHSFLADGIFVHNSKVNLQNLPSSGSRYSNDIKRDFEAPPNWFLAGADFTSLEDKISALLTKDPNKIKVYTDGYDGHCLRAYSYFTDQMPDILNTVESINSIEQKYPKLRQRSKGPTFALTYQGTFHTLMNNLGLSEEDARSIEDNYHILYTVSDKWVQDRLEKATQTGYVTVAFGLRLRTPILGQTLLGKRSTPYEAKAEGRTAGNAMGQSYGMLNNRAAIEFQERLFKSEHKYNIKPIAHIHDAQYFLIKQDLETIKWFNDNLIECMEWQDLPELHSNDVKLGGGVEIYIPTWEHKIKIPNKASITEINTLLKEHIDG
jgi:DNA polymerase-1